MERKQMENEMGENKEKVEMQVTIRNQNEGGFYHVL